MDRQQEYDCRCRKLAKPPHRATFVQMDKSAHRKTHHQEAANNPCRYVEPALDLRTNASLVSQANSSVR